VPAVSEAISSEIAPGVAPERPLIIIRAKYGVAAAGSPPTAAVITVRVAKNVPAKKIGAAPTRAPTWVISTAPWDCPASTVTPTLGSTVAAALWMSRSASAVKLLFAGGVKVSAVVPSEIVEKPVAEDAELDAR
jgi:hypothetical protein